jgi:TetR/AcrR family transcriptional regulator
VKLTKRLVKTQRRKRTADDSRERLFSAAKLEFAAHGFAGASVDRIAAAARLNKAMIYYHFGSKAALYRDILRDMFAAVGARVTAVAASAAAPAEKIRLFVDAFAAEADARPHFPPIWFREIAEGGKHLDTATITDMAGVLKALVAIIGEGARAGRFKPINPLLVHAGIIAPVLLFFASAPLRARIAKAGVPGAIAVQKDEVIAHVQRVTLGLLEGRL